MEVYSHRADSEKDSRHTGVHRLAASRRGRHPGSPNLNAAPHANTRPLRFTGPCVSPELGDPFYEWLVIDCPAGKVTLGRGNYHNESEEFYFFSTGEPTIVSFYFRSAEEDQSNERYAYHSPWERRVEGPQGGRARKKYGMLPLM